MALNKITHVIERRNLINFLTQSLKQLTLSNSSVSPIKSRITYSTAIRHQVSKFSALKNIKLNQKFYSIKALQQTEIDEFRNEHNITVIGKDVPSPFIDIDNSEFPDYIKKYLKGQNFSKPTIIQSQGWPIAMSGRNFVGIAQTGTGKTLAYILPAMVHIKEKSTRKGLGPIALVLAPTRELARQIEQVVKDFERLLNIRCACIYGGANRSKQADLLQSGVDIVIATPGRLNDFLTSKTTTLSRCTYVVLDEADRMLDMGFEPQIRQALEGVPLERQILMFSATWPKEVRHLAKDYLGEFVQVNVGSTELSANHNIQQNVHICHQNDKIGKLKEIMHNVLSEGFGKTLVFTNTKRSVDFITQMLRQNGWPAMGIHGDKTQLQRDLIINKFKSGGTNILVATDVAARGLDVDGVTHVINYDYPNTSEDYIHRIGRTGRQDNTGVSHTILTEDDARLAKGLIEVLKEAKQEIPGNLATMANSYDATKTMAFQAKWKPFSKQNSFRGPKQYGFGESRQNGFGATKSWHKFRSPRRY